MTNEEFEYARDSTGHTFEVANWNCAQALPWYMLDGNAVVLHPGGGYDQLPLTLASAFTAGGGTTFMSTPVASVESVTTGPQGATTFELTAADGSTLHGERRRPCDAPPVARAPDCPILAEPRSRS